MAGASPAEAPAKSAASGEIWKLSALDERLSKLATWDEYYRQHDVNRAVDRLVARIAWLLELPDAKKLQLRRLIHEEQRRTTRAVLDQFGSEEALNAQAKALGAGQVQLWNHVREIRDRVRRSLDVEYASHFDEPAMALINQHMRGDVLVRIKTPEEYRIGGVGERYDIDESTEEMKDKIRAMRKKAP